MARLVNLRHCVLEAFTAQTVSLYPAPKEVMEVKQVRQTKVALVSVHPLTTVPRAQVTPSPVLTLRTLLVDCGHAMPVPAHLILMLQSLAKMTDLAASETRL